MSILEKLDQEIKGAAKAKNTARLATIRLIKNAVKNKEIELLHPLSEAEFYSVLSTMAKQGRESIEQFKKGGRNDLVDKETGELNIIETFLPKPLTETEVARFIDEAVAETEAQGPKDMGKVMKALKEKTAGRIDGKTLSEKVRSKLSQIS